MISFNVVFFFLWFLNISGRSRPFSEYWERTTWNEIIMFIGFNLFFVYGITMTALCLRRFKGRNNDGLSAYITLIPNELN
uniref:Uncharacterized protein n=1 Tax=Acrobeloides nanus TaxID=290746 RepID=A0A914EHK1_9BILA